MERKKSSVQVKNYNKGHGTNGCPMQAKDNTKGVGVKGKGYRI